MTYSIKVDHKLKIIRYKHVGNLSFEDIGSAWKEFLSLKEFTKSNYNLLSDYSEAVFDMDLDQVDHIINYLVGIKEIIRNKKQSIIINHPYSTAGTVLFKEVAIKETGFLVEIFSTEKAALEWLLEPY